MTRGFGHLCEPAEQSRDGLHDGRHHRDKDLSHDLVQPGDLLDDRDDDPERRGQDGLEQKHDGRASNRPDARMTVPRLVKMVVSSRRLSSNT